MFHILHWFNIENDVTEDQLKRSLDRLTARMKEMSLVESATALGRRCSDSPSDTDTERDQKYFYILSFRDREQSDQAYAYIEDPDPETKLDHDKIRQTVKDAVFVCWEDI